MKGFAAEKWAGWSGCDNRAQQRRVVLIEATRAIRAVAIARPRPSSAEGPPTSLDFGAKLIAVNGQHAMGRCGGPFAILRVENVAQPRGRSVLSGREGRSADAREQPQPPGSGDSPP
jgi:hypothetical protein